MEQTTPQPTRPVMDVARPRPAVPVVTRAAAPAATKPAEQPTTPAADHTDALSEPPKLAVDHKPEEAPTPKPTPTPQAPQALAVRKAPADDGEKPAESAPVEPAAQDTAAVAEEQAHQESTVSTGPHAPVGVIVVTVLAMILLCALATMIYFDTQK